MDPAALLLISFITNCRWRDGKVERRMERRMERWREGWRDGEKERRWRDQETLE